MRSSQSTELLAELSAPGRGDQRLPACDVPMRDVGELLSGVELAAAPPALPEVAEPDLVRHYVNLSTQNMCVDSNFYPLGSCTMKYNPKRNDRFAAAPGVATVHPHQRDASIQGLLELLYELQGMLAEISGLPAVSLQPAAGAHGEFTALLTAAAHFRKLGENRPVVLSPDSAHGTNPASAAMAGFRSQSVASNSQGLVDLDALAAKLSDETAVFMITNPNTLGLFERQIGRIADMVHEHGALLYLDGANLNAILGRARPGDFGADMMHFNPHKTFSTPHGGGGPGAGPIAVTERLAAYLPAPVVARREGAEPMYYLDYDRPESIGRVRSFFGNTGVLVRAYAYLRTLGPEGCRAVADNAVLNANYLAAKLRDVLPAAHGTRCMHEFVASASKLKSQRGLSAMHLAKRLLDYGFHAPTVYFPTIVPESVMIEPTETESKATLDAFAAALHEIIAEGADGPPEPRTTAVKRPDEVAAARKPVLK